MVGEKMIDLILSLYYVFIFKKKYEFLCRVNHSNSINAYNNKN